MPKAAKPRAGSMQFWPRKRAKREVARVRSWPKVEKPKPLGFAGYKVGMTHLLATDAAPHSTTKGIDVVIPATIIECPPIKVLSVRFYHNNDNGLSIFSQINSTSADKEILRRLPKITQESKTTFDSISQENIGEVHLIVYTQPKLTGIGKKKPEVFEVALGGKPEEQIEQAKNLLGKTISVEDVLEPGSQVDIHAITKGKGFQGPVKRFGVSIRSRKSEKTKRGPGSLGPWKSQGKILYRVAHAGQMGYFQRVEYNKWIIKIDSKPEEVNPVSGFKHYGLVKNTYLIVKGSVAGPAKRLIRMNISKNPNRKVPKEAPSITFIKTSSMQG